MAATIPLDVDRISPAQKQWAEICHDPALNDLPYKIETNPNGQIILSPTSYEHGRMQAIISRLLDEKASESGLNGEASVETSVELRPGQINVPDAAWISSERLQTRGEGYALTVMPEIVVEVLSPGNDKREMLEKRDVYLKIGAADGTTAEEMWIVDLDGHLQFFTANGPIEHSRFIDGIPNRITPS